MRYAQSYLSTLLQIQANKRSLLLGSSVHDEEATKELVLVLMSTKQRIFRQNICRACAEALF